ncbi:hypothetical protein LLEC1_03988 [Akanthomyces lecanii]|uniref:Methyltransferase domain-containing protein n=1 Tax=Cordyceps confragosa TaxID=2714763 RepID=A0A179ICQ7_CORDF|nr:hypothetical protein LLEC1_03988 [Akanthomyces lecanii]
MAKFVHGYNLEVDPAVGSITDEDHLVSFAAKNKLASLGLAPVESPQHCLDVATGTGIWAIQYVLGTDLSLIQGGQVTPNCRFVQQDLENENWKLENQFDHIHFRHVVTCFDDTPALIKKAYDSLKPGGWIEFFDMLPLLVPLDDTVRGTAVEQWYNTIFQGARIAGRDMSRPKRYAQWCEDTGFVNMTERRFPLPSNGRWPKDSTMKKIGEYFMKNQIGLVGSLSKFVRLTGLSEEKAASLEARAKEDLRDPKIHYYVNICMVYAQKPLDA